MNGRILKEAAVLSAAAVLLTGCQTVDSTHEPDSGSVGIGELIGSLYVDANSSAAESSVPESNWDNTDESGYDTSSDYSEPDHFQAPEGGHLTILSWTGNSETQDMVEHFIKDKGYSEFDIEIKYLGDYSESAKSEYRSYLYGDGDADIIVLDNDISDEFYESQLCMPLSDIGLFKSDFTQAFNYTLELGTNQSGVFMGVSPIACPGGFVYRADLAREYLGVTSPEEMQELIGSWDGFVDTGRKLYSASGQKVSLASTYEGVWQAYKGAALPWVDSESRLNLSYSAEHFFDIVDSLRYNGGVCGALQWDMSWYDSISGGSALGEFLPTWGLTDIEYSQLSQMCDNGQYEMAFCKGPGAYYWGGTIFAVANKCDDPTLAREFLEYTCINVDSMREYAEESGAFVNNRAVVSSMSPYNSLLGGEDYYKWLVESADEVSAYGHTQYDSEIAYSFISSAKNYIDGTFTRDDAIREFKLSVAEKYPSLYID